MAFSLDVDISRKIVLNSDYDAAFEVFSDISRMVSFFPKVQNLEDLGGGAFKWTMEESGVSKYKLQVVYAVKYEFDKEGGRVKWAPVPGVGNAKNYGDVTIESQGGKTVVNFSTRLTLDIPFSKLAKPVIKPFVNHEFVSMMETFQKNVEKSFNG